MNVDTLISLALGTILGAICSWLITYIYYKKSDRSQKILFDKLTSNVRTAILQSNDKIVGKEKLKELLSNIVIDGGNF